MKKYFGKQTGDSIDKNIELVKTALQDVTIKTKVEKDKSNDFKVDVNEREENGNKEIELIFNVPSNNNSGGGGGNVEYNIDDKLSSTSTNPVQNKVITEELNKKGTYSKPNTGIPENDLSNSVQESLNKAKTALQSYEEQYTGTIKGIKMNGVLKGNSGIVDLGTVLTEHQDVSDFITEDDLYDYATKTWVSAEIAKAQLEGDDVDLSGYATKDDIKDLASEEWVNKNYATISQLNIKVDKVNGKQLSTEDFTTLLKQKLENLSNYDDTDINNAIISLQTQLNTLLSGNANDAINSFNEIIAFLEGIEDSESLDNIIASIEQQIASKQDKITDLSSIRSGAAKGETAVQPGNLSEVATSGSYNDLSNKPTIPSAVTESTVSGWGFTKNTGTYSKPSTGIPKNDLSSNVQTSLNKADTALQSYTEQYKGTVTGVKVNGSTKNPNNGVVDLGTVITAHQDISGKQDIITDLATIRSGAQKGATALQSYTETDPVFKASPSYNIKNTDISNWNNKISGDSTITKIVKVSSLPSSPDSNTLYIIV